MNIILAGMPGCGKSTVSLILGKKLNAQVADTDAIIVSKHGDISKIFASHGEEYFRTLETEAVKYASSLNNAVISTGGGCLLKTEDTLTLKKSGKIVYLETGISSLVSRTQNDSSRPLLTGDKKERLKKLLSDRAPVYENAADFVVRTDGKSPEEVAEEIIKLVKEK